MPVSVIRVLFDEVELVGYLAFKLRELATVLLDGLADWYWDVATCDHLLKDKRHHYELDLSELRIVFEQPMSGLEASPERRHENNVGSDVYGLCLLYTFLTQKTVDFAWVAPEYLMEPLEFHKTDLALFVPGNQFLSSMVPLRVGVSNQSDFPFGF